MAPVFRVIRAAFPGGTGAEKLNGEGIVGRSLGIGRGFGCKGGDSAHSGNDSGTSANLQEISSIHIEKGFLLQN